MRRTSIIRQSRRSSVLRQIATAVAPLAIAGQLLAQDCPGSLLKPPILHLSVSIDDCDYLATLAEARFPRECKDRRTAVAADLTSRVHALEGALADSLRSVFQDQYGFLRWKSDTVQRRWSVTVHLKDSEQGDTRPLIELQLRDGDSLVATSEAFTFETPDESEILSTEQRGQGPGSLDVTRRRWAAAIASLLARNDGVVRTRWLKTSLWQIPLTTKPLPTSIAGTNAFARLAVRDADIRADWDNRPSFAWHIAQIRHVIPETPQDTARDPGDFQLGQCVDLGQGYRCKMLGLKYGSAPFPTPAEIAEFLRNSPKFIEPMALYVIEYRPARLACALRGINP